MFAQNYFIQSATSEPDATYLTFIIPKAGSINEASGTLSLFAFGGTFVKSWKAGSGDNDPAHQDIQWDETDNNPWGGPIPSGAWAVRRQGDNPGHPTWYPLDKVTYTGPRFGFYIHGSSLEYPLAGVTHGCICLQGGSYANFVATINSYWPNSTIIPLYVSTGGVGGIVIPVDKFGLLAPYIGLGLGSTILLATMATVFVVKRRKQKGGKEN